jgi:hypothetical protein
MAGRLTTAFEFQSIKSMAKGGARPGAGRKKGSKTVPQFRDYVSDKERKKFVEFVLSSYMGDMRLTTWMGDQLFGKAPQPLTNDDGEPIAVAGFVFLRNENNKAENPANS